MSALLFSITQAPVQGAAKAAGPTARRPNIILILADDLGYADLGAYGAKMIRTPRIDQLARDGIRLTDYYAPANLCTPSRAGILTGRYPIRTGLAYEVLLPGDKRGLPDSEVTIADLLKRNGYATGMVGKWHLGYEPPGWPPRRHGFDFYFGVPGHNDLPVTIADDTHSEVELLMQHDQDPAFLTQRFTDKALEFIEDNVDRPFFLYFAHTAPHLPLFPHPLFKGHSRAHAYGDVVAEIDNSLGRIRQLLASRHLARHTLIIFTSDNGPWFEGDSGGLHDRKGAAGFDGGYRVPFIVSFPGRIPTGGIRNAIAMGIDILPTVAHYAGVSIPTDREIDGRDLSAVFERATASPHDQLILFNNEDVAAIRTQRWKLVVRYHYRTWDRDVARPSYPPLFDMSDDPGERFNAAQTYPQEWSNMRGRFGDAEAAFNGLRTRPASGPAIAEH